MTGLTHIFFVSLFSYVGSIPIKKILIPFLPVLYSFLVPFNRVRVQLQVIKLLQNHTRNIIET